MFRLLPVILAVAAALTACASLPPPASPQPRLLQLAGQRYQVVIADDPASHARGLMHVPMLPDDHGMLFVLPSETLQLVWMRDTRIPLDVLFFDAERRLVSQLHALPPCPRMPCPYYSSGVPARYMLEINAGQAARLGLLPGVRFELP